MSEIAIVSARKARLQAAVNRGDRQAKTALDIVESPNKFFSTVQIGITLIGILTGIFSGEHMTEVIESAVASIPFLQPYAHSIAVGLVVLIITFFSLVFGELVPKRIGLTNPEGIAKVMAGPMNLITTLTAPFVWLLTVTTDLIVKIFGIKPTSDSKVTEEEIKAIIQEGTAGGEVQEIEQDIVERVFILGDRKISSLMTHRNDIIYLRLKDTADEIRQLVNTEMHSLYPVFDEKKDNIIGVVLLKDLFKHISEPGFSLEKYINRPQFISENVSVYETLKVFKDTSVHYGIITDEYGQMQGIVTLNDLLKALVGDVSDFYAEDFEFIERDDHTWLVDGQYPLYEFLRKFDLDDLANDYTAHTVGGLILQELKVFPTAGHKLNWLNFEIEVLDMDGARIDKLMIRKLEKSGNRRA